MKLTVLEFTFFIILLLVVNIILFIVEWFKLKKFTKMKILNAHLTGEFAKISIKYQEYNRENKFDKTPGIKKYLKKAERIVHNYSFDVFSIKVYAYGDKKSRIPQSDVENRKKIINELTSEEISKENKLLFYEMNALLEIVYQIQHPIKYSIMTLKKNILLQILKIFVRMVRILLMIDAKISKTSKKVPQKKVTKKTETIINGNMNSKEFPLVCAA